MYDENNSFCLCKSWSTKLEMMVLCLSSLRSSDNRFNLQTTANIENEKEFFEPKYSFIEPQQSKQQVEGQSMLNAKEKNERIINSIHLCVFECTLTPDLSLRYYNKSSETNHDPEAVIRRFTGGKVCYMISWSPCFAEIAELPCSGAC